MTHVPACLPSTRQSRLSESCSKRQHDEANERETATYPQSNLSVPLELIDHPLDPDVILRRVKVRKHDEKRSERTHANEILVSSEEEDRDLLQQLWEQKDRRLRVLDPKVRSDVPVALGPSAVLAVRVERRLDVRSLRSKVRISPKFAEQVTEGRTWR